MKSHSVKSNAKRAARKLCDKFGVFEPADPVQSGNGEWFPAVTLTGALVDIPAEVTETAVISGGLQPNPVPATSAPELRASPAGRVALAEQAEAAKLIPADIGTADQADDISAEDIPAFLNKRVMPEPEMVKVIDQMDDDGRAHLTVSVDPRIAAILGADLPPRVESSPEDIAARRTARSERAAAEPKPAKQNMADVLVALASRPEGATSEEMQDATKWQAHTLRGYIAGTLRKRGHRFELRKTEAGRKAYHC